MEERFCPEGYGRKLKAECIGRAFCERIWKPRLCDVGLQRTQAAQVNNLWQRVRMLDLVLVFGLSIGEVLLRSLCCIRLCRTFHFRTTILPEEEVVPGLLKKVERFNDEFMTKYSTMQSRL